MWSCKASPALGLDKGEDVGIHDIRVRRYHSVGEAWVDLEGSMLQQFCLQQRGVFVRYDLVVVALDHESWYRDRFQILRLVCLRESLNAFVMSERAAHHALTPPILDNSL